MMTGPRERGGRSTVWSGMMGPVLCFQSQAGLRSHLTSSIKAAGCTLASAHPAAAGHCTCTLQTASGHARAVVAVADDAWDLVDVDAGQPPLCIHNQVHERAGEDHGYGVIPAAAAPATRTAHARRGRVGA